MVISSGLLVFVAFEFVFCRYNTDSDGNQLPYITLNNYITAIIVFCQLLYIILLIRYMANISTAYYGYNKGLFENISIFDYLQKFDTETFWSLNVNPGILFKISRIIAMSLPYSLVYVCINNYFSRKVLNLLQLLSILLLCGTIVLTGSRSPLFRVITMAILLIYFFNLRNKFIHGPKVKYIIKGIVIVLCMAFFFVILLQVMGRESSSISNEVFKYIGAPLANLDTYLQQFNVKITTRYFGENTFNEFYKYLYDKGFISIAPTIRANVLPFNISSTGLNLGNVYTMFYFFIIDFGYLGIVPCTGIMAVFYMVVYKMICQKQVYRQKFSYSLFFFGYLINDLIMAFFSNRFYETVLNPFFPKFVLINIAFGIFILNSTFKVKQEYIIEVKKKLYKWL